MKIIKTTNALTGKVSEMIINEKIAIGDKFRLIGNTTVFRAVALPLIAGFIPAVHGISLCGNFKTTPRIADTLNAC